MTARPEWTARPERGSAWLLRLMIRISLAAGRPLARVLLWPITGYFWLATPRVRADSRRYLARALGRPPTTIDVLRHYHTFSATVLDRVYLLSGRVEALDVRMHGEARIRAALADGQGAFLVGAHFGSFEALRAAGRQQADIRVTMAMFENNARTIGRFLRQIDPSLEMDIIALGSLDSMLRVRQRLDRGDCVGFLADRAFGVDTTIDVPFLGAPAPFPTGAFRMAAVLRRPVLLMVGVYRGGNRYDLHVEPLADFSRIERGARAQAQEAAVRAYAARLEHYCHDAPYNWFNFYDFWQRTP
ncbi:MAG: acyl-CoA synthetase [Burkholderiaceae bacterium]